MADRDADYDKVSQLATEQKNSLRAVAGELITDLKAGIAAKDAEIAEKNVEIARLRAVGYNTKAD